MAYRGSDLMRCAANQQVLLRIPDPTEVEQYNQ